MSSRPFAHSQVITNGNMALASVTSSITILTQLTVGCYSYSWSGSTPVGTVIVEISNDYSVNSAGTWTQIYFTLNGSSVVNSAPVTGNTGTGVIEFTTGAFAIRTTYTKTSGTGSIQAVIHAKVA